MYIRAEHLYITSTRDILRPLTGVRYFDDLLLWTIVRVDEKGQSTQAEVSEARNLLDTNQTIYPSALRLLEQRDGPSTFKFLKTQVTFGDALQLTTSYLNKNAESLNDPQPHQTILRFRHGASASPRCSLMSVITCMLGRVTVFETQAHKWVQSILLLIREFLHLEYPTPMLLQALHKMARHHPLGLGWRIIADIIQDKIF